MPRFKRGKNLSKWNSNQSAPRQGKLRIVGGKFRGRQIEYTGDPVTRPMKDNIREALFNLVGGWVKDKVVFDLFAGTGAMGLEALSRGGKKCFFIERHIPSVRVIQENVLSLDSDLDVEINSSDTFFWVRKFLKSSDAWPKDPWVVFCCPPYAFYVDRTDEVLKMIGDLMAIAPDDSVFVVESDGRFDPGLLPDPETWSVRKYAPALVAVRRTRFIEQSREDENQTETEK